MALHRGPGKSDERPLSVNPFFGEADPVGGMIEAPPKHRLPDGPLRRRRRTSWCTTS